MSRTFKSALVAAILAVFAPAALAEKPVTVHVEVDYTDLDLSREAGAKQLLSRIERASNKACGRRPTGSVLGQTVRFQTCRSEARSNAVRDVDAPMLTALFIRTRGNAMQVAAR